MKMTNTQQVIIFLNELEDFLKDNNIEYVFNKRGKQSVNNTDNRIALKDCNFKYKYAIQKSNLSFKAYYGNYKNAYNVYIKNTLLFLDDYIDLRFQNIDLKEALKKLKIKEL